MRQNIELILMDFGQQDQVVFLRLAMNTLEIFLLLFIIHSDKFDVSIT